MLGVYRAIKRIPKEHQAYSQLMREVHILKSLKHPNVPIIYDIEEDEKYSYIIEEYLQGESLKTYRMRLSYLNERSIIDFTFQICDFMKYLHTFSAGILYLDLKPENILVHQGKLKFLDFGAAVYESEYDKMPYSMATPGYAAPEWLNCKADKRSDIYSIGCLIYFLVTGTLYQPSRVSRRWSWMLVRNRKFYKIIEKCVKPLPESRFRSVGELENCLKRVVEAGESKKESAVMSYCIAIAGSESRVGVTHIALSLASYVGRINKNSIYIEWNESGFLQEFVTYCKGVKEKGKYWCMKHVKMQEKKAWNQNTQKERFRFAIKDYGVLTEQNMEEFLQEEHRIVVAGVKPWEWKTALYWMKKLCDEDGILYLLNGTFSECGKREEELLFCRHSIHVPYLKHVFYDGHKSLGNYVFDSVIRYVVRNEEKAGDKVSAAE